MGSMITDGKIQICAIKFPDRKNETLSIQEGSVIKGYATFKSDELAEEFMDKLAKFVGAKVKEEIENE